MCLTVDFYLYVLALLCRLSLNNPSLFYSDLPSRAEDMGVVDGSVGVNFLGVLLISRASVLFSKILDSRFCSQLRLWVL